MKNLFLSLAVLVSLVLFSCEKENEFSLNIEEAAIIENDATIEDVIESSAFEVDLYSANVESINAISDTKNEVKTFFFGRYRLGQAPLVTIESNNGDFPKTITLNYGEGTELANGRMIRGSIIIEVSAQPRTDGAVRTVTFSEFFIDSVNIAGNRVITFVNNEEAGFSANEVSNLVITFPNGITFTRTAERVRTFVEGYDTPREHADDVLHITGFVNTVCSENYTFTRTIVEPLVKKGDCRYIVSGLVSISKGDEVFAELNYGDGSCDDKATIIKDGVSNEITIGRRIRIRN